MYILLSFEFSYNFTCLENHRMKQNESAFCSKKRRFTASFKTESHLDDLAVREYNELVIILYHAKIRSQSIVVFLSIDDELSRHFKY